jgi:hypothetical protein
MHGPGFQAAARGPAEMITIVGGVAVQKLEAAVADPPFGRRDVLRWEAGLAIDADGAPTCYGPRGLQTLDRLANAGKPGNWWGLVTDSGKADGEPLVQRDSDPAPGYYISTTALVDHARPETDPRRYVDATVVPYLAIPPELLALGAKLGDVALARHGSFRSACVIADVGPRGQIGEGSPALARALGINPDARGGGTNRGVACTVFCGTRRGWPRVWDELVDQLQSLMLQIDAAA